MDLTPDFLRVKLSRKLVNLMLHIAYLIKFKIWLMYLLLSYSISRYKFELTFCFSYLSPAYCMLKFIHSHRKFESVLW